VAAAWDGSAPGPTTTGTDNATAYDQMRTHKLKAAYTITTAGEITNGDPTIAGGWGTTIRWNATNDVWEKTP